MNRILHFIQYHNAFVLIVVFVFIAGTFAFANEDVRDAVFGESVLVKEGIDNSKILQVDLDQFDVNLQIQDAQEDSLYYSIAYRFTTLGIVEYAWEEVMKEKVLKIDKFSVKEADLRSYVAEELNEVAEQELAYLREVQKIERAKGVTQFTASLEHTGLIGLLADLKDAIFQDRLAQEQSVVQLLGEFNPTPQPVFEERPVEFLPFDFSQVSQEFFSPPESEVKEEESNKEVSAEQNAEKKAEGDVEESVPPAQEEGEVSPAPVEESKELPPDVKEAKPEEQETAVPQEEPVSETSGASQAEESSAVEKENAEEIPAGSSEVAKEEESAPPEQESASEEVSGSGEVESQAPETNQTSEQE